MPYARFDDRYDDHRKIRQALRREPAAVALHAMAITYCSRHVTDGIVDGSWVDAMLSLTGYRAAKKRTVLDTLIDLELFERVDDDTFRLHGFLDWNLSREQRASLAEQGRRGGRGSAGPRHPGGGGAGSKASLGSSQGLSQGSSHPGSNGSSTPSPTPTPRHTETAARKRATRRVDQSKRPENFPDDLVDAGKQVLTILRGTWDVRGGIEPQPRGVGLAILRNPKADHVAVARKLEHWLLAGRGQRANCNDIAARYGDWVAEEDAAQKPGGSVHQLAEKQERTARRLAAFNRVTGGAAS